MTLHSRETKVFVILGVSIILCAVVLNILGYNPPSAGAFCLSRYNRLDPVGEAILSRAAQYPKRWNGIEIFYTNAESEDIRPLSPLNSVDEPELMNCHFIICNGRIGYDGQIQSTEKWQRQLLVVPEQNSRPGLANTSFSRLKSSNASERLISGNEKTIRICVLADPEAEPPTNCQIKRTEALVEKLCKKFFIQPESIRFPNNWQ
ncbi:MAG: N-acetylmuramoyl-L-alanine amidase [Phycisphaerales bacterium]